MKIQHYTIKTVCGELSSQGDKLDFLTEKQTNEFNLIGYSGKDSKGNQITRTEYLNKLRKGTFTVEQIKFDNGDFSEKFRITRVQK